MICGDCGRKLEVGDQYIEDTPSGYIGKESDPLIDGLVADIFGGDATLSGGAGGKIVFCEDCTERGGDYRFSTYYGDEEQR